MTTPNTFYRVSDSGQLKIQGPAAASFLHRMISNEVQKLALGEGRYQGLLDRKGMTLSLFFLVRTGAEEFLAVLPSSLVKKTADIFNKMKFIEKLTVTETPTNGLLKIFGETLSEITKDIFILPEKTRTSLTHNSLLIWKEEAFKVPCWNIAGPIEELEKLETLLKERHLKTLNKADFELIRMRSGFPEYGVDLGETHILLESGLTFTHQREKGCYPGQEVVERILAYGKGRTPKRLTVLVIPGEHSPIPGTEIITSVGAKAGVVTSSLYDPSAKETVVMGYVENKFLEESLSLRS